MPSKRKRRKRAKVDPYQVWFVLPENWDASYGFGVNASKWGDSPYSEYETLVLMGRTVEPTISKYEFARLEFSGADGLDDDDPKSIGILSSDANSLSGYVRVPIQRIGGLIGLAISGRLRSIYFTATRLRYRNASIINCGISTEPLDSE